MFHHRRGPPPQRGALAFQQSLFVTYQDGRIIWHARLRLAILFLVLGDLDVLDISPTKDDVIEFLAGGGYEVLDQTTFGTERIDVFEGDSGFLRIDFVERAQVTDLALGYEVETLPAGNRSAQSAIAGGAWEEFSGNYPIR